MLLFYRPSQQFYKFVTLFLFLLLASPSSAVASKKGGKVPELGEKETICLPGRSWTAPSKPKKDTSKNSQLVVRPSSKAEKDEVPLSSSNSGKETRKAPDKPAGRKDSRAEESSLSLPVVKEKRGPNKESYILLKENFSNGTEVDFTGIYGYLHYKFQKEQLLVNALFPLLPKRLQKLKQDYANLEFLGDSVLGLIVRERIIALFPQEKSKMHNELYVELTCNRTLAEVYVHNLKIEQFLPYPEHKTCKYCNVVEAIIGAIHEDEGRNLTNTRKFAMRILDDHVLQKKWKEIKRAKEVPFLDGEEFQPSFMLPPLRETIDGLLQTRNINTVNPKSFLGMILEKTLQDQPEYKSSIGRDGAGAPLFVVHVVGAQIGQVIKGEGTTRIEAEENAARNAINFLAQRELFPLVKNGAQSYTKFIHEYCQSQMLSFSSLQRTLEPSFTFQVRRGGEVIGEGKGPSKAKAKESATKAACTYLLEQGEVERADIIEGKTYQALLKEWEDQKKIGKYEVVESKNSSSQLSVEFQVKIGEEMTVEGKGLTKEEARENANRIAFELLLSRQEEALRQEEMLRNSAKRKVPLKTETVRFPGTLIERSLPSSRIATGPSKKEPLP